MHNVCLYICNTCLWNFDTAPSDFTVLIYLAHAASFHWCSSHKTLFSGTVQVTSIHQSPQTVSLCRNWAFPNLACLIWSQFFLIFSNTDYDCFDITLLGYWYYWYIIIPIFFTSQEAESDKMYPIINKVFLRI